MTGMSYEIKTIECSACGKTGILGIFSYGVQHQRVQELICPNCVTGEHLSRVGRQDLEVPMPDIGAPESGSPS